MHVVMVIGGGLGLLAVFLLFGHLWAPAFGGPATAARVFLAVWLLLAMVNLWVGVAHAGYSLRTEIPIFFAVFAVPAVAVVVYLLTWARH